MSPVTAWLKWHRRNDAAETAEFRLRLAASIFVTISDDLELAMHEAYQPIIDDGRGHFPEDPRV
jgi:hypothetical protein